MASERVTLTAAMLYDAGREDGRRDAAAEIARLTRELEEARNLIRELVDDEDAGLVWLGRRLVCAYCTADGLYSVAHAADCPIIRARHALVAATEARERCPVCGHAWCRHDPADGRCDAASEDPLLDGAVCPCGRDLAWMQARIAELSRHALAKDTVVIDGE